ncbi:MAG: hypothetical protein HKM01_11035 [Gallionella sp.]|jgi:hypothetical protein|nr:hypothetical protein [Gallionella sp.]NNM80961.1 hypothetical protein [Gallionella sp.]
MSFRKLKRKFSIDATQLSVRPHVAWYVRWSIYVPFVLGAIGMAWWAYDSGLEFAGFHRGQAQQELEKLHTQVISLSQENATLNSKIAQYEQQIQIDQASSQETTRQLKTLNDENAHLQEDLAFFQNLTESRGKEGELGIHRLKLEHDSMPGEYRVRMLLVQSGQRAKQFVGSYQLVATLMENGQRTNRLFPGSGEGDDQFKLNFKYYQRVEQALHLPPAAQLESVQVRVFESDAHEPKARQTVSPT